MLANQQPRCGGPISAQPGSLRSQRPAQRARGASVAAPASSWNGSGPYSSPGAPALASDKLEDYLKTPFDLATFGPRLAVGALLSAQEAAESLQADLNNVSTLLQDPRPVQDKQQAVAQEVEQRLAKALRRGADAEAEVLTAVAALLPPDVRQQLPPEVQTVLARSQAATAAAAQPPLVDEDLPPVPIATVTRNQTAAELEELAAAVVALREALSGLAGNADATQAGMLRVKVVDSRAGLARRLQQLSPAALNTTEAPVSTAVGEANLLLQEVEAMRL